MLGGAMWVATWILPRVGVVPLDLSERGWRTLLLNPAMLLFTAGLVAFHRNQRAQSGILGRTGFVVGALVLLMMLLGNITEFWVFELFYGTQQPGWVMMGVGLLLLSVGLLLLGLATLRAGVYSGWRRAVPFGFGLSLVLLILAAITAMLVSGSRTQEGLGYVIFLTIAAGWVVLGYALWSERSEAASSRPSLDSRKIGSDAILD
jgi:Ca2+/H+ antiporter